MDPSVGMLKIGQEKIVGVDQEGKPLKDYQPVEAFQRITLAKGDAENLAEIQPLSGFYDKNDKNAPNYGEDAVKTVASGFYDLVTMSFGIRNVRRRVTALQEMNRALKMGGRLCLLEFSIPRFWNPFSGTKFI